jgi:uncharacterized membrane protein
MVALGSAVAVDYSNISTQRTRLQAISDASALAAVREFRLGNASSNVIIQAAHNHANSALSNSMDPVPVMPSVDANNKTVTVQLSTSVIGFFPLLTGRATTEIRTSATAKMVGEAPICVVGLDSNATSTVEMEKSAKLSAPGCSVYSNSKKPNGLIAKNSKNR